MLGKHVILAVSAAVVALAGTPVESGTWTEDHPDFSAQECAGGVVDGDSFYIPDSPDDSTSGSGCSNGHLRAERRYTDDYTTGTRQFGGQFVVNEMTGSRISIKQTFNGNAGPYFILGIKEGGDLYSVEGGATIASGVATVGTPVRINTVHNAGNHRYSVYVNGVAMYRDEAAPGGSFYDKLGAYTTDSGTGDLNITWTDVQFWHGGN